MFIVCPLVHNYSVITLDNCHLAYYTVQRSQNGSLFVYTVVSINRMVAQSPFVFLFLINICSG